MAKILVKNSVTSGSAPAGLSLGEMAINITDKKIFVGNAVESTVTVYDPNNHVLSFNGSTGAVSFVNYVSSLNGATGAITNVAVTNAAQTFSGLQSFSTGISAASILAQTVGGDEGGQVDFGNPVTNTSLTGGICIDIYQDKMRFFEKGGSARGYYIDLSAGGAGAGTNLVGGGTGAVSSVTGTGDGISVSPTTGAVVVRNTGVISLNGSTGAITNVARINEGNTFTAKQVMNAGITASDLYISGKSDFDGIIDARTTTNVIDVVASTDGAGLRIAQATTGSPARVGGIRLGRSTTHGSNVYLEGYAGSFRVYNGLSGTVASAGTKMLELSPTNGAIFGISIAGATFTSTDGRITVQKNSYTGSDSGTVRIVGTDTLASFQYNSDIRANEGAAADTTHTLPAVTGTLLNTASSYVSGVNGITGPVGITAGSNITITLSGKTLTISSTASGGSGGSGTGFTYASSAPSSPSVGDRWIDSDTGREYVYVYDGSSSQWIEPTSSNGLIGLTYYSATSLYQFGGTGSFVKLGVGTTAPAYTLDVNGNSNFTSGISAASITLSGGLRGVTASFSGAVSSDAGYQITSGAINALTGTTYTLLASDNGKVITWNNNTSGVTLTVPSGLSVGFNATIIQIGTGSVGITGSGVTLNSFEGKLRLAGQHAAVTIISYASNIFNVAGGLTGL